MCEGTSIAFCGTFLGTTFGPAPSEALFSALFISEAIVRDLSASICGLRYHIRISLGDIFRIDCRNISISANQT